MSDKALTPDAILDAAEAALRRFGPAKTSVIDVARSLGVSHGALYRHFDGKAELLDAVVGRWLERMTGPLAVIAAEVGPATERLRRWFDILLASLQAKARNDAELFAAYGELARAGRPAIELHAERLATHIAKILDDGADQGAFRAGDAKETAGAILNATIRFHHPLHAGDWSSPEAASGFETVFRLILRALTSDEGKSRSA